MNQCLSILIKSFLDSDLFGKGIFLSLFALSIGCWIIISYKSWIIYAIKKEAKKNFLALENSSDGVLNIPITSSSKNFAEPFYQIYIRLKKKAVKSLEKNRYFTEDDSAVFLTKDDLTLISADMDAAIASEMKKIDDGLYILTGSVSLAPFLGILGTVWGILISLFEMQKGASTLSNTLIIQGLSTALGTTVIGLLVAIPALIGSIFLKSLSKSIMMDLGLFSHELLTNLELQYKKVE